MFHDALNSDRRDARAESGLGEASGGLPTAIDAGSCSMSDRSTPEQDTVSLGTLTIDRQRVIRVCDRVSAALLESDAGQELGRLLDDYIAPADVNRFVRHLNDVSIDGRSRRCELQFRGANGRTLPIELDTAPIHAPDGRLEAYVVSLAEATPAHRLRRQLEAARAALADQLRDTERLHDISMRVVDGEDIASLLQEIMDVAIEITHADMGNMLLFEEATGDLVLRAHSGLSEAFLQLSSRFNPDEFDTSCGRAFKSGRRVVVEDVTKSEMFACTPVLDDLLNASIRAMESTPLVTRNGRVLGVITTHYRVPTVPDQLSLRRLDLLARQATDLIERTQSEAALNASAKRLRSFFESSAVLMAIVELRGDDFVYVQPNAQLAKFFGMSVEALSGKSAREVGLPEAKIAECVEAFRQCQETNQSISSDHSFSFGEATYWFYGTITHIAVGPGGPRFSLTLIDVTEQKTAEAALRLSEDRYRTFVDHAVDALLLHDENGVIIDVNRHACESLGYAREELIGSTALKFDSSISTEELVDIVRRMNEGEMVTIDSIHRRKDGTEFPVEVRCRPFWVDGRRFGISLARDISVRKRAEDELRTSEMRYRTFVDHASDAFFLHDANGRVIDVNRQACKSLGYDRQDLIGKTPFDFDPALTQSQLNDILTQLQAGEAPTFDTYHQRSDGTVFPVEIRTQPLDIDGERHNIALVRDMTERKRAEEALSRSEARFRGAIENIPDVIVIYDCDLRIQYINAATQELTGRPISDFLGRRDEDVWPPEVCDSYLPTLKAAKETRTIQSVETDIQFPDGSLKCLHIRCVPLLNDDGTVREVVGITQDLTERKKAEQAVRESEQRFSQFMEHLPGQAWIKNSEGRYVYVNQNTAEFFGLTQQELQDRFDKDLVPSDVAAEFLESDRHVLSLSRGIQFHESRTDEHGVERHALVSKFPIPSSDGESSLVGGVAIDITEQMHAEETIRQIVDGIVPTTGQDFFRSLVCHLSSACHVDHAFVSQIDRSDPNILHSIAVCSRGEIVANASYDIRGTPCEHLMRRGVRFHATGVREAFPDDKLLAALMVDSYMGVPLFSSTGEPIGLMALMHSRPIAQSDQAMAILRVIAARAGAELEREGAQADLDRTRMEYDFLAESFPFMVFRANDQGLATGVNDARWMRLTGGDAGGWRGNGWLDAVHAEDRGRVSGSWRDFVAAGGAWSEEFRFQRSGGGVAWVLAVAVPMRDSTKRISDFFGAFIDITHLIETKQALRLTQFSVDQASIAIYWSDCDGRIRYVNDWACTSIGYSRNELLEMSMCQLTQQTPEAWKSHFEDIKSRGSMTFSSRHRRKDGSYFPVEITVNYVRFAGEEFLFGFAQDLTERKKVEDRIEQQNAELAHVSRLSTMGQMVATLSHELAQPLSAVANYSSASIAHLNKAQTRDSNLMEYLDGISRQTNRAGEILRRVRDFVRNTVPQKEVLDLNLLLRDSMALMSNDYRRHQIRLVSDLSDSPLPALVDRVQVQQVVVNLLANARDAVLERASADRRIAVRSSIDAGAAVLEVEDSGVGLSTEIHERVFEPFVTTKENGMGIGLSICKSIVESHAGRIIPGTGKLGGALFRVVLPLAEGAASEQ
ncbi:MAG: PAS domain S-box protein [Phycisphaerales bacterium]|nr:PAS domain S-box protein [Phycisphaerales bacterium]MCB9862762.1 PAS domain S-box protein [Phycisphaerales bacterium]